LLAEINYESESVKKKLLFFLACVVVSVLFQGCSKEVRDTAELKTGEKELVRATVTDPARATRLLGLLEEWDRLVVLQAQTLRRYREQFKVLNADYNAKRNQFDSFMADFRNESLQRHRQYIALIVAMKKETTAEEWEVIAGYQLENFNQRERTRRLSEEGN